MKRIGKVSKKIVFPGLAAVFLLIAIAASAFSEENFIQKSILTLKNSSISDTNEAMLILKRYQYYLSKLENGDAYLDWQRNSNPPIYNATVFLRMMDRGMISRIVQNATGGADAYKGITGFFERAYISEVDGSLDSYIIYLPQTYRSGKKYPLVVLLHGWGDSAYLNPFSPAHFGFLKACEQREVIMAAPCGRQKLPSEQGLYIGDAEKDVLQVMKLVKKYYSIDEKKVYLTGNSMGGFGTWSIASRHPEFFAAIAPVCGVWSGLWGWPKVNLDSLTNIPVYMVHASGDRTVPVTESRSAFEYLKKAGGKVKYLEIDSSNSNLWDSIYGYHNAWDYAYEGTFLIDWFLKHTKQE